MAYHHEGEEGRGWLSAKVLTVALLEGEKSREVIQQSEKFLN